MNSAKGRYRALYTYAWDLAEAGVDKSVEEFKQLGLETVTMAASYHAGKFLRPHGENGKVYFPDDGTVYFRPDPSRYGKIKPVTNAIVDQRDVLRELCDRNDVATNAWLVLLHNSRLGMANPEICSQNAFGDRYIYSLSPSHPEARAYAVGLASDVTENYYVRGISMESPGFAPYAHGYHHEFSLFRHNRWMDCLLGLDFSPHAMSRAQKAGIDAERLRAQVAGDLQAYLASDIDFPDDMAEAFWLADVQADGDLRRYLDFRSSEVTSLVREIREAVRPDADVAVIPSVARPTGGAWYEGSDLKAMADVTGIIEACFYEPSAARIRSDLFDIRRRLRGAGAIRAIMRPAHPDLTTKSEFLDAVAGLRDGGVTEFAFYNWGHLRRSNLKWIGEAMKML
jgi:hypothetical protein